MYDLKYFLTKLKNRIIAFFVLGLATALTIFFLRLVHMDCAYYGKSNLIEKSSDLASVILPLVVVCLFLFKKTVIGSVLNIIFLSLSLAYGFILVGREQMLTSFLLETLSMIAAIIFLTGFILWYRRQIRPETF
jgi:hypothetical protein